MEKQTVLITGANGEIGHGLIPYLSKRNLYYIIALDINGIDPELNQYIDEFVKADILDRSRLEDTLKRNPCDEVFHLAALLSTAAEKNPELAHKVNVDGTFNLLELLNKIGAGQKRTVKFIFPSSIAVYGLPDVAAKQQMGAVRETDSNQPITMYGINKLYCERLGIYFSKNYKLLDKAHENIIDFRCIRFPGIISAQTMPTGGTSDYAPEMLHSAARGEGYESFVREDTTIPFMVMPDAVKALIMLSEAPKEKLTQLIYNAAGFSARAKEIADMTNQVFPDSAISYSPDEARQRIIDSWPAAVDDSKAKTDWGWSPDYNIEKAFKEYLIPAIKEKYSSPKPAV